VAVAATAATRPYIMSLHANLIWKLLPVINNEGGMHWLQHGWAFAAAAKINSSFNRKHFNLLLSRRRFQFNLAAH
jgi:hypothetical protein